MRRGGGETVALQQPACRKGEKANVRLANLAPGRSGPVVLEAVPPELGDGEAGVVRVLEKIRAVHERVPVDLVNIPEIREESSKSDQGERRKPFAPRMAPRELALRVREGLGLESMINRVVVHMEARRQADWFRETYERYGVRRFVLVGGERSDVRYPGPSVSEANELIRETLDVPDLVVGNICIPGRRGEARRMARKMAAGADLFTTQILYHAEEFTGLLDDLREQPRPECAPLLLVSVCPVRSAQGIRFLHWLGVSLSADLESRLTAPGEPVLDRSVAHIEAMWRRVVRHGAVTRTPFPLGISLAPIGPIPAEVTAGLGRRLSAEVSAVA